MCGIAGLWTTKSDDHLQAAMDAMTDALVHRGPDDRGTWIEKDVGLALGHRRLSIIDLSAEGHQPMKSAGGRYVVVYNGEIYNFSALRKEVLAGTPDYPFRGTSDTETLLAAIETFGFHEALARFNGMFAFALWDRRERQLHLVRDRLGIKPLYYGLSGGALLFGSELKALQNFPRFDANVDPQALADLLRFNSIPAPRSIFANIHKLEPGTIATFTEPTQPAALHRYWDPKSVAEAGLQNPFAGTAEEAVDRLEEALTDAVGARMVADVPLGAFLSGGVDSSTVVALMQSLSSRPIKTFSMGFHEAEYNEATHAAAVAKHLGTDHTERYVTADDALAVIPNLPTLYDEPFADSSQIPTFLVSQLARETVTVSLSGDGGDELFAGYNRHIWAPRIGKLLRHIPRPLRQAAARAMLFPDPNHVDGAYEKFERLIPKRLRIRLPSEKLQKFAGVLALANSGDIYNHLRAHWKDPAAVVMGLTQDHPPQYQSPTGAGFTEQMMFNDLISYLPDDILTKVDRASMGVSLEARVPLLDHHLVEFAWRLPMDFKLRDGTSKWALRQVLYRHVPRELIERPKMGFGIPIDQWLRGPLREWAEELLAPNLLMRQEFFYPRQIQKVWQEHIKGRANHQHLLWNVLSFQAWWSAQH